jgi:hypothetical protein
MYLFRGCLCCCRKVLVKSEIWGCMCQCMCRSYASYSHWFYKCDIFPKYSNVCPSFLSLWHPWYLLLFLYVCSEFSIWFEYPELLLFFLMSWMCLWEPTKVKWALPSQRSPRQLQRPLVHAPPSDKSINMRTSGTLASEFGHWLTESMVFSFRGYGCENFYWDWFIGYSLGDCDMENEQRVRLLFIDGVFVVIIRWRCKICWLSDSIIWCCVTELGWRSVVAVHAFGHKVFLNSGVSFDRS